MRLWVLDTDTFTLMSHHHTGVTARALSYPPELVTVSIVTVQEAFIGRYDKIKQAKKMEDVVAAYACLEETIKLLRVIPTLSYHRLAAEKYETFRKKYRRLPKNDLQIAAIAMTHDATLVTCNLADFGQVDGLSIEDWSK
jgi:tRNA(fMet)-specific endonuclease VapC